MAVILAPTIINAEGSRDEEGYRHYTVKLQCVTASTDGPLTATSVGLPNMHAGYSYGSESDSLARLKDIKATQAERIDGGNIRWIITLSYDSKPYDTGQGGSASDPETGDPSQSTADVEPDERPPTLSCSSRQVERILDPDLEGEPVVTSAGQKFTTPVTVPQTMPVISMTWFSGSTEATLAAAKLTMENAINLTEYRGIPELQGRCTKFDFTSTYEHGRYWYNVTCDIECDTDRPYNPVLVLDAGTLTVPTTGSLVGQARPIIGEDGSPVSEPVPLNGMGGLLAPEYDLVYREFVGYREVEFSTYVGV